MDIDDANDLPPFPRQDVLTAYLSRGGTLDELYRQLGRPIANPVLLSSSEDEMSTKTLRTRRDSSGRVTDLLLDPMIVSAPERQQAVEMSLDGLSDGYNLSLWDVINRRSSLGKKPRRSVSVDVPDDYSLADYLDSTRR